MERFRQVAPQQVSQACKKRHIRPLRGPENGDTPVVGPNVPLGDDGRGDGGRPTDLAFIDGLRVVKSGLM